MLSRIFFSASVLIAFATLAPAEERPGFVMVDHLVGTNAKKESWGHVAICMMKRREVPVACFGLEKKIASEAHYRYFLLFKQDPENPGTNGGVETQANADGKVVKLESKLDVGEKDLLITIQRTLDEKTGAILEERLILGDREVKQDGPRVFLADFTGEGVKYIPVEVPLPKSTPDLSDRDQETWPAAIAAALAELKEKSPELRKLLGGNP